MKALYDTFSYSSSKTITRLYSTSFSLGIFLLDKTIHNPIYSIYGFVRVADEIVDSFHDFDKSQMLQELRRDTYKAINEKISLNPILNSFQSVVNEFNIENELIDTFLDSMEMDLEDIVYDSETYEKYILGSAEVVGLMCLRVFTNGDTEMYENLKPYAMSLGSAFQKINFLRDLEADFEGLGRTYFPGVDFESFDENQKLQIEKDIKKDFDHALIGIRNLPKIARLGVYAAYVYYTALFQKIRAISAQRIMKERIRISNPRKLWLTFYCAMRLRLNLV
ncbi:phytoene/squalene synthase family protein [Saprospiraceae bacterium]|jgi:phytoene synthase|nr:phytoene/squalene synthase family protein [Bacteroidota bacterium]MDB4728063.1 phytoene/squalene synthase family protein [Saprospiraceae bacterium]